MFIGNLTTLSQHKMYRINLTISWLTHSIRSHL